MRKFISLSSLIFIWILFACTSQEQLSTSTPEPTYTITPSPTFTPLPKQSVIMLQDIPPKNIVGNTEKAKFPSGTKIYTPEDFSRVPEALSDHALVPVFGSDGSKYGYVSPKGKNFIVPLDIFMNPSTGEIFYFDKMDVSGIARYLSEDGTIEKWAILSIWCPRMVCVQVISYNQEDKGHAYWLGINPSTGAVEKYFPIFHDKKPVENKHMAWEIDGKEVGFERTGDKWTTPLTGASALWKMNNVMGLSYEPEMGLIFISDGTIQRADNDDIYWQNDFGGYVVNQDGIFIWNLQNSEWVKSKKLIDEKIQDDAEILLAGGKRFVEINNKMHTVTSIESDEGKTKITISSDLFRKFVWNKEIWSVWQAERIIKEIPRCESMYDTLTIKNELNPEHIIDSGDLQAIANWIQTQLTSDMFDPVTIKPLSDVGMENYGRYLIPEHTTAPNYIDPATAPYLKDNAWCATARFNDGYHFVIFIPYYIEGVAPSQWPVMIGVNDSPLLENRRGAWHFSIDIYTERMNVIPWMTTKDSIEFALRFIDPFTGENFTRERILNTFIEMETGDFSNTHDLVLFYSVGYSISGGRYFE